MSTELDPLPFARLARLGLPPRVRSLIEGSFQAAMPDIEVALARALDELDRDLVTHTERGSSPHEQNQCFASLREFRQRRNDFLSICRTSIQRSLLMLADADIANESAEAVAGRDGNADPAVVEASGRDEDLALSQIAARAEIRAAAGLQALAYRFGVIAGSAPIEIDALPLGPNQLCAAIRSAARRFDVFPLHRMALYRRIDKCLFADPTALYDAVNSYLCAYRVYANLKLGPRPTSVAPAPQSTVTVPPQLAEVPSAAVAAPVALAGPAPQTPLSATGLEASTLVDAAGPVRETALDATFFRVLRERVSARRRATQAVDAGSEGGRQSVDSRELQVALRALQIQPLAPLMVGGKWANRSVAHVKQDLMSQLRSSGDGQPRKLRDEDADTIDLIGLVFGQLLEAYRANSLSHAVVSRLQIPVLRAALRDPSFYAGRIHPAW
ncbi:MAG TPA: DUF1631 family protein, partial [Xanthomonadales bacterium]|nr:DUF1631 family protein [Xanthomonadales bacterium]